MSRSDSELSGYLLRANDQVDLYLYLLSVSFRLSMSKIKLIRKVIVAATLSVAVANLGERVVQAAQRSTFLLRAKCVNSGLGNAGRDSTDISIDRQVYTSLFYLAPGDRSASITCNVIPGKRSQQMFQTLELGFGMRDNVLRTPPVTVKVYLDGKQADSKDVAPAKQASISLNISSTSNVSVEATCSTESQYCDRVYFYQASLEPKTTTSSQNK